MTNFIESTSVVPMKDKVKTIHLRKMRFEEARKKLLNEIESAFFNRYDYLEVIHGIGTYTLRKMVEAEAAKIDYIELVDDSFNLNPGTIKIRLLIPEK